MLQTADGTTYKSRLKVLLEFFRRSRDAWKSKCMVVKAALTKAHNRNRWLETSRDNWKARGRELEAGLQGFREEIKRSTQKCWSQPGQARWASLPSPAFLLGGRD